MALYPTRYGLRACRWIPHFSVYLIPFGGTHTFRRKPHFLALPPESTIRDPTEAPKTCSDTRFHARSAPCQKHNKPLEFLVLPSKTRNPRGPVRTHTFGIKMSVLVVEMGGDSAATTRDQHKQAYMWWRVPHTCPTRPIFHVPTRDETPGQPTGAHPVQWQCRLCASLIQIQRVHTRMDQ